MKNFPQNIVITGAASGIGKALSSLYLSQGHQVFAIDYNESMLKKVAQEFNSDRFHTYVADVSQIEIMKTIAQQILANINFIDIVVANAGIGGLNPADHFSLDIHKKTIDINCLGIANTLVPFIEKMISQKSGSLVGISSLAGFRGLPNAASYASSKAQQKVFLESLRVDLQKYNIAVSSIHPGFVKTAMTNHDDFVMPFMVSVEQAAKLIANAIHKKKSLYLFPFPMKLVTFLNIMLPNFVYDFIITKVGGHKPSVGAKIL